MKRWRLPHKNKVYDRLHMIVGYTLVASSVYMFGKLLYAAQDYVRVRRPEVLEKNRLERQAQMAELQMRQAEELARQEALQKQAAEALNKH